MKWKFAPVSLIKTIAASLSAVTLVMSPVAQGAAAKNQRELINQYLKETGLTTKKQTVGEFWKSVRHVYPPKLQKQLDQWVSLNRNEMMPTVEANTIKGSDGKEHVRLTMFKDGQSFALTFTGDEDTPLKVNNVSFSKKEILNYNKFNAVAGKVAKQDKNIGKLLKTGKQNALGKNFILTQKEFKKLTARQKAEYFVRARQAAEAAQRVMEVHYGIQASNNSDSAYEWVQQFLFGNDAYAASAYTGKPCIVAGYMSTYGENGSCGGNASGAADLKRKMSASGATCSGGGVSCNPMVYGFSRGGGAHCVPRSEVKYATRFCNSQAPLGGATDLEKAKNKKAIIESYLANKGQNVNLQLNDKGEISEAQYKEISTYLSDLQVFVNDAISQCEVAPLKDIKQVREDQDSACNELRTRAFSLQQFGVQELPPPPPIVQAETCDKKAGSQPDAQGKCSCPEGTKDDGEACLVVEMNGDGELPAEEPGKGTAKEDSCGFWCRNKNWIIPVGIGIVAAGLLWWLFKGDKKKSKNNDYIPPATGDVEDDTPGNVITDPVITVPDPAPCPYPNTYVAGVCTPPSVVQPEPVASEGGTAIDSGIRSGGVR